MSMHSQDPKQGIDEKKVESIMGIVLKVFLGVTLLVLIGLAVAANL